MTPTLILQSVCPTPEPLAAAPDDGGDAAYFALAEKLGVRNAFIVRHQIENALREEHIQVFDRNAVDAWMNAIVEKENANLRAQWKETHPDAETEEVPSKQRIMMANGSISEIDYFPSRFLSISLAGPWQVYWGWQALRPKDKRATSFSGLYPHPVPFAALDTMDRILQHVPDAGFLVSNYAVEVPDPFLMVTHRLLGTNGFVIERWDEPGFRG